MPRETTRSGVIPWPTPVGIAVVSVALFTRLLASTRVLTIGPLIALGIMLVVDYALSARVLHRRPIEVDVTRTHVVNPDAVTVRVTAPTGSGPVRIAVERWSLFDRDSEFATLVKDRTEADVVLESSVWGRRAYLRLRSDVSMLGLVFARRWSTHRTADIYRTVEAIPGDAEVVGEEEAGRIRTYLPGDRLGTVAWSVTARTGQLHVRAPSPDVDQVTVVVELGRDIQLEDHGITNATALGHALRVGEELLARGQSFLLVATEHTDRLKHRMLERALASPRRRGSPKLEPRSEGPFPFSLDGEPACRVVSSMVFDRTELIRRLASTDLGSVPRPPGPYIEITPAGVATVESR